MPNPDDRVSRQAGATERSAFTKTTSHKAREIGKSEREIADVPAPEILGVAAIRSVKMLENPIAGIAFSLHTSAIPASACIRDFSEIGFSEKPAASDHQRQPEASPFSGGP